ncbi:MAG: hypothetical protein E7256_00910 [Lachnospiraceae bacterium]|nr:hypothetical protein [Lachnospiraceae bacterium]
MLRWNPIFIKEIRQNARMKKTAVMLALYNGCLALFGLFAFYLTFRRTGNTLQADYGDVLTMYGIITGIEFILVLCIVPAITATSIAAEREKQTLDILMTTPLSRRRIIFGKLASAISIVMLLTISSLPVISVVFSIGGITIGDVIAFILLMLVCSVYAGSIGIMFSCICKKTVTAVVSSYVVLLMLIAGLPLFLFGSEVVDYLRMYGNYWGLYYGANDIVYQNRVAILLLNPFFTFLAMVNQKFLLGGDFLAYLDPNQKITAFIADHWFALSIGVQAVVSVCMAELASLRLAPAEGTKRKNRRKERDN